MAFVGNEDQQQKVEKILGKGAVAHHCSGVSFYNYYLGNLAQAIEWWYKVINLVQQLQEKGSQAFDLNEASLIEMAMGDIRKARETVSQALNLSLENIEFDDLSAEFNFNA